VNLASQTSTQVKGPGPAVDAQPLARSHIHDFGRKLRQASTIGRLRAYVAWQRALRRGEAEPGPDTLPALPLVSINLDVATACNHACRFCVDADVINSGKNLRREAALETIETLHADGLKSVILIGGGEPTLHPAFREIVRKIKSLGMQLGVVTNGTRLQKIIDVADELAPPDWVRLSLDAARDETYQAIHNPHGKGNTLDSILARVPELRAAAPDLTVGYSFVVTWRGLVFDGFRLPDNIDEIPEAAERARDAGFTYLALKPCLEKTEANRVETLALSIPKPDLDEVVGRIQDRIAEARARVGEALVIHCSVNLTGMFENRLEQLRVQPNTCHIGFLRQVISPLGVYHCPAFRGDPVAYVAGPDAYASAANVEASRQATAARLLSYDARVGCRNIACFYNDVNWAIERMIESEEEVAALEVVPDEEFFL